MEAESISEKQTIPFTILSFLLPTHALFALPMYA